MVDAVTGAFGYTGRYITRRLLSQGRRIVTLTGHPDRENPFGEPVTIAPFSFEDPAALTASLEGAETLYNTYWIRFARGPMTFERAVDNTRVLIRAAVAAGVRRIVHLSITRPSEDSPLLYFRGKAILEREIRESGLSYAILRPTVIFGAEDILINNIAWLLRRYPLMLVPGRGDYRLQPIYVEDLADLAVTAGRSEEDTVCDAVGPEILTFDQLLRLVADAVRSKTRIVHVPPTLALLCASLVGKVVGDVMLTRDEVTGLMANLLYSDDEPTGTTRLSDWLRRNAATVGAEYHSEVKRHYR